MAMRDAWLAGAGLRENMTVQSAAGNPGAGLLGAALLGPVIGMLGAMADLAAANRQRFDQSSAEGAIGLPPGGQENSVATDFVVPMSHAMMIAANRSASYWFGLAQILASHQARFAQAVGVNAADGRASGAERLLAADELRALLREVGDLAVREARILQSELSNLDERLAQNFQQPDLCGSYRRRWRSKI
ncbi:hypothetical protein ACH79_42710 [Bradyrhizobium sp. CCBAU 051011]|nr:hypothetical protein ACH79_42710 [Bradyrhizobium sp. CCBAU 051011]